MDIDKDCGNGNISLMVGNKKKLCVGNIDMKLNFNHFLIIKSRKFDPFYHFFICQSRGDNRQLGEKAFPHREKTK